MLGEEQILRDRYHIQCQLGHNSGRRTLLAQDLQTQELVVLKILTFNSDFRWEDLKLFEREAETLKSLSHPAIPRYLDSFELHLPDRQGFVLVQTYIPATSLQEWIKRGRTFSEEEVKQIAKALLNVLSYLHSGNPPVIHRDIKPSNILLTSDRSAHQVGDIYLVDFGSVQTAVREIGTMTIVGTYGYMPPEQFSGRAFPASDLYSLGATLIYLVTGRHPADLLQEDLLLQFEPVPHLVPSFVQWLKQMTHPNRKQRFSSAQAALATLEQPSLLQLQSVASATSTPLTLQKPDYSKVSLLKDAETLEIYLPPETSNGGSGCTISFLFCFTIFSLMALIGSLPSGNGALILVSLLLLAVGSSSLWQAFFISKANTYIYIDRKSIKVTQRAWKIRQLVFQASRSSLYKLTYVKRLYRRDTEAGIMEVPPELKIWATEGAVNYTDASSSYRIGQSLSTDSETRFYGYLTTQELDWLAQELSNWLELPITRE
ncbi:serine/threonine-protein kinase [Coleofasciculus sp. FACHB-129]|uniref:serine/threonine protein kinase n=1 Tax=Cyanophyceae TaxID=3028117 RepID=UPI0016854A88|nr:serine/threonine-protein kinase [Coleofasciculus sp. FACHB-129]MBD1893399.1 serine/threonine protein kinase [Coleofasciculus sp. FACHB-129]